MKADCGRWRWAGMVIWWLLLFGLGYSGSVEISWKRNLESDHQGYRVHYGTASRKYSYYRDVGDTTFCTVNNLEKEVEYFFAATAYDSANNESAYSEEVSCILKDNRPLTLVKAILLNPTILAIEFNKKVARTLAIHLNNYSIDHDIQLQSATLLSDGKNVHLKTSEDCELINLDISTFSNIDFQKLKRSTCSTYLIHVPEHRPGLKYKLTVNNLQDIAHPANTIAAHSSVTYDYTGAINDRTGPLPLLVNVTDSGRLEILFNKALDPAHAEIVTNYKIQDVYDSSLPIFKVFLDPADPKMVHIHTAMHHAGLIYRLSCTGIRDRFGNQPGNDGRISYQYTPSDAVGPTVRVVNAIDPYQVDILFNEKLEKMTAETISNFSINNDIMVISARLNDAQNLVHLETSEHRTGEPYLLRITGIRDKSPRANIISPNSCFGYVVAPRDSVGPTINRVEVLDNQHLAIIFNEAMAPTGIENPDNYQIDHGVQVLNAFLNFDRKKLELFTTAHEPDFVYTLALKGLRDASLNQNKIPFNTTYSYSLPGSDVAPTIYQVDAESATRIAIRFSKEMDKNLAEMVSNYQITPNLGITKAQLNPGHTVVELTIQPHEEGLIYKLRVSALKSKSGLAMPHSTFFRYTCQAPDRTGPMIAMVRLKDATHLDVAFNEPLDQTRAQMLSNYKISDGIEIYRAAIDGTGKIVSLETSPHLNNKHYFLTVTGVSDDSPGKNFISPHSQFGYSYDEYDNIRPFIFHVNPVDYNRLDVIFSEPVESASASQIENYQISDGVGIRTATPDANGYVIHLETGDHVTNRVYCLTVNGIRDISVAGNRIQPNSSMNYYYDLAASAWPKLTDLIAVDEKNLLAVFNKKLEKSSVENIANYRLSHGVRVLSARQLSSQNEVMLATTPHEKNRIYTLLVSNLAELGSPEAIMTSPSPFVYPYTGRTGDASIITSVTAVNENLVRVTFDREMDRLSTGRRFNYHINNGVQVFSCELEGCARSVYLRTGGHQAGQIYMLTVSGVRDVTGNPGLSGHTNAYTLFPRLEMRLHSSAETDMALLELNKPYYLDRDYVITEMPGGFEYMRMIRTRNDDQEANTGDFIRLHLTQNALVYVAYDSRATAFPAWLSQNFYRTPMYLGVSDKCKRLEPWGVVVPAGETTLGGNLASGAKNAKSMYVVLITEVPANFRSIMDNPLALEDESSASLPEQPDLRQNYPNPFNPTTIIGFQVPSDCRIKIDIFNVLGKKVRTLFDDLVASGNYNIVWDGTDEAGMVVAAGVYFYRLEISNSARQFNIDKDRFIKI